MRLIVRNRHSLHVWNVSDYIKQTQANIAKQDTSKYITLHRIFRKLIGGGASSVQTLPHETSGKNGATTESAA